MVDIQREMWQKSVKGKCLRGQNKPHQTNPLWFGVINSFLIEIMDQRMGPAEQRSEA